MKISSMFFTCTVSLVLTSAMQRRPSKATGSANNGNSTQRVRVFIHLTNDLVYSGFFYTLIFHKDVMPRWVQHQSPDYDFEDRVYLRMPDGEGALSVIEPLEHPININDNIPGQHRCWLLSLDRLILSANLRPYDYEPLPDTGVARCFVRMPDDNTVHVGELEHKRGDYPSWIY